MCPIVLERFEDRLRGGGPYLIERAEHASVEPLAEWAVRGPAQVPDCAGDVVTVANLGRELHDLLDGELCRLRMGGEADRDIGGEPDPERRPPAHLPDRPSTAQQPRITPGPNNLMLMASGANLGVRRTLPHMSGVVIGFVVMAVVIGVGPAEMFQAFPVLLTLLKVASVGYLLFLAWKIATASGPGEANIPGRPMTFLAAAAFQWVNPKAWAMVLTAVSVYAPSKTFVSVVAVSPIFGIVDLPAVGAWVVMGQKMRRVLTNPARMRAFNVTMALLLIASSIPVLAH